MPADGGRVTIWSFYWSVYVMVDKGDRPVNYYNTWRWLEDNAVYLWHRH